MCYIAVLRVRTDYSTYIQYCCKCSVLNRVLISIGTHRSTYALRLMDAVQDEAKSLRCSGVQSAIGLLAYAVEARPALSRAAAGRGSPGRVASATVHPLISGIFDLHDGGFTSLGDD